MRFLALTTALALGAAISAAANHANAQEPDGGVLDPSTRPMWFTASIGPALGITGCGDGGCSSAASFSQFKLGQDFGYHFSGDGSGPAIGAGVEEAFGDHVMRVSPGFKFWYDIQPSDSIALYIAPMAKVGYTFLSVDAGPFGSATEHAFNVQAGVEGRLVLADRGMVFLRPFTIDSNMTEDGVLFAYDVQAGGGVTF